MCVCQDQERRSSLSGWDCSLLFHYTDTLLYVSLVKERRKEDRLEYFNTLDEWAVEKNLAPFADLVAGLTERSVYICSRHKKGLTKLLILYILLIYRKNK